MPLLSHGQGAAQQAGIAYDEINLSTDPAGRAELVERTGMMTFPQVIVGDELVGGYTEVVAAANSGRLDSAPRRLRRRACVARDPLDAGPRLAALADVGPAPADDQLAHRAPQTGHGSPSRRWTRKRSWKLPRTPSGSR